MYASDLNRLLRLVKIIFVTMNRTYSVLSMVPLSTSARMTATGLTHGEKKETNRPNLLFVDLSRLFSSHPNLPAVVDCAAVQQATPGGLDFCPALSSLSSYLAATAANLAAVQHAEQPVGRKMSRHNTSHDAAHVLCVLDLALSLAVE